MSNISPEGFYGIGISLKKFERSDEGNESFADLMYEIEFSSPAGDRLYRKTVSKHIVLNDRTFLSLAKGLSKTVSESVAEETSNISFVIRKQY
jgi:hypothetical protein